MKRFAIWHLLLIITAVSLAYLNSFQGVFQFDDYKVIVSNPLVHSFTAWVHNIPHGIRPLLRASYVANWTSPDGVFRFHLFNLLVHTINALFVYGLTARVTRRYTAFTKQSAGIALLTALLFALHPVQTEAVTYISGGSTALMTAFYLASFLVYIEGRQRTSPIYVFVLSPLLFLLAVFTKELAVTLPIALLLWELTAPERTRFGVMARQSGAHWGILVVIFVILIVYPNYGSLLEGGFDIRPLKTQILSEINAVAYLASKLVMITGPNIDPDLPMVKTWSFPLLLKAIGLLTVFLGGALTLRRIPWLAFGILWFFLHLVPTNSIVPREDLANDRQLYLPMIGLWMITSAGIAIFRRRILENGRYVLAGVVILFITLGSLTFLRNSVYRSEIALWEDTRSQSPYKARVHNNLGCAYALAGRDKDAQDAFRTALTLNPAYDLARANLEKVSRHQYPSESKQP